MSEEEIVDLTDLPPELIMQLSKKYQIQAGLIPNPNMPRLPTPKRKGKSMRSFREELWKKDAMREAGYGGGE